jgi:hypothetical protein
MQRPEASSKDMITRTMFSLFVVATALLTVHPAAAATYTVTNMQCEGADSLTEAMRNANDNPGLDTITFTSGLVVDFSSCPPDIQSSGNRSIELFFALQAEESVIFEGNGAKLEGVQSWIAPIGSNLAAFRCNEKDDILSSATPGFIRVGDFYADSSGISVTVRDLEISGLSRVARVGQNATLIMEDVSVSEIYAGPDAICNTPAVAAAQGANVALHNTAWKGIRHSAVAVVGTVFLGLIAGENTGDLTIEDSFFADVNPRERAGVLSWFGQAGSKVNIVSSRFEKTGGIAIGGDAAGEIVNSIWVSAPFNDPELHDRIVNFSSQELNIIASTLLFSSDTCYPVCQLGSGGKGWVYRELNAAPINFTQSAVGVNFPNSDGPVYAKLLDPNPIDAGPGFSADEQTWIMETELQDATALKTVTDQPLLLTDPPGLPTSSIMPARATPLAELVDVIDDAVCDDNIPANDGVNALRNPIDLSCITLDALGNPRVDGNGKRDIGAVQLTEAPHLSVSGIGDGTVGLSWSKPGDLVGLCGYRLTSYPGSTVDIQDPDTLSADFGGLLNGIEYDFTVEGLVGCPTPVLSGFPSNLVTATPLGPIEATVVSATPGDGEVALSWTQPDLGGRDFKDYTILWRVAGTAEFTGVQATYSYGETSTIVTGLKNGTEYEFAVAANASGEVGPQGFATATPHADIGTVDRNPDERHTATKRQNKPKYWENQGYGAQCTKSEVADDFGSVWDLGADASALILKSDRINDVWVDPTAGLYGTASAKDVSHAIVCTSTP